MIKSVEHLGVGDTFKIGNTPVVVTGFTPSEEWRKTHMILILESLYSDGGRVLKLTLMIPKIFLVELFEDPIPKSQQKHGM